VTHEKFKVITGSDKEHLIFYSTLLGSDIRFRKGDFYQFSTKGEFSVSASEIVESIKNNESYKMEKVSPSVLIKEL